MTNKKSKARAAYARDVKAACGRIERATIAFAKRDREWSEARKKADVASDRLSAARVELRSAQDDLKLLTPEGDEL
jgi:hypothetical protein